MLVYGLWTVGRLGVLVDHSFEQSFSVLGCLCIRFSGVKCEWTVFSPHVHASTVGKQKRHWPSIETLHQELLLWRVGMLYWQKVGCRKPNFHLGHKWLPHFSRSFGSFPSPSYGNCFIFNFEKVVSPSKSSALPGPGYGLSLVLNLEMEQYGEITKSEGARWVRVNIEKSSTYSFG